MGAWMNDECCVMTLTKQTKTNKKRDHAWTEKDSRTEQASFKGFSAQLPRKKLQKRDRMDEFCEGEEEEVDE